MRCGLVRPRAGGGAAIPTGAGISAASLYRSWAKPVAQHRSHVIQSTSREVGAFWHIGPHKRLNDPNHTIGQVARLASSTRRALAGGHASRNRCACDRFPVARATRPVVSIERKLAMSTVLLVDDDAGVRFALTEVLCDRGYRVIGASSGAEALASLDGVDVVVTDLSMPGMDGLELLSRIAARAPTLPVILLTAHGSEHMGRI